MAVDVHDVPESKWYEAAVDGAVAGRAGYILTPDLIVFTHTEVDPAYEGRGVGGALVRAALDDVRGRGLAVLPVCPFVKGWIEHHPEYGDLVYRPPPSAVSD